MFIDARGTLPDVIRSRVCVVGAGVAGIALALELERAGIEAVVLESGGYQADASTRDLYRGDTIGLRFAWEDGARTRYLGGSSNCWGGWCAPFRPHELSRRDWIPDTGWPLDRTELDPYYARAQPMLGLGPFDYDVDSWVRRIGRSDVVRCTSDRIDDVLSQFATPPALGARYRRELADARCVRVLLHANAVEIESDSASRRVTGVQVRTLTGRSCRVEADDYVLATGGIENARLLLASDRAQPGGLGNEHDLVGRYFADHPRVMGGAVILSPAWRRNRLYDIKKHYRDRRMRAAGTYVAAKFIVRPDIQAAEAMTSAVMWFSTQFHGEESDAAEAVIRLKHRALRKADPLVPLSRDLVRLGRHPAATASFVASRIANPRVLEHHVAIGIIAEPTPERDSRVTLSDRRDALGMRRAAVDWRIGATVKRTIDRSIALLAEDLRAGGIAHVVLPPRIEEAGWPPNPASAGNHLGTWHHMGTTRMHDDPTRGVVDRHCRVHGVPNLHVAGSSVFPTYGADFPTMTLTALAIRLADRLADRARPTVLRGDQGAAAAML